MNIQEKRQELLDDLTNFVMTRPRFEPELFGCYADYKREWRESLRDRDDALRMIRFIENHESITFKDIVQHFGSRLRYVENELDYIPNQYYPAEYRAAACSMLSNIIFTWMIGCSYNPKSFAKKVFGKSLGVRWFS